MKSTIEQLETDISKTQERLDELKAETQQLIYPKWFKSINCGQTVRFTDLTVGEVVASSEIYHFGKSSNHWTAHTDAKIWVQVDEPTQPQPKETYTFSRALHLMRYAGKKMRYERWVSDDYLHIEDETLFRSTLRLNDDVDLKELEIMGSWVEVE